MSPSEKQAVIDATRSFIEQKFRGEGSGHDWWHMYRVWQLAKHIASKETGADLFIVELASLLHDIADWKFTNGNEEVGPREARRWLESQQVDEAAIQHIEDIIRNVSFKGGLSKNNLPTIEGKIVHDADKLDAIGAIGIARTFAYGGAKDRAIYDPDEKPQTYTTAEEYRTSNTPSINHFYEKLLLLKDRMLTRTGKELAQHRHEFMEQYLREFYDEWGGKV